MGTKSETEYHYFQSSDFANGSLLTTPYIVAETKVRSFGPNNPGWRRHIALGINASSGMTVDIKKVFPGRRYNSHLSYNAWPHLQPDRVFWTLGDQTPPVYHLPQESAELHKRVQDGAAKKAFNRLRQLEHQFQGGVFLGEIVPTFRMLVRPFGTLRDSIGSYFSKLKAARVQIDRSSLSPRDKTKKLRKVLADTWLETSFGWQPLLSDVKDAAIALARYYADGTTLRLKAHMTDKEQSRGPINQASRNLMVYQTFYTSELKYTVVYYGNLWPLPNGDKGLHSLHRCVSLSGFDLRSFIPTLWELLPYSFLVDYFTNIGDIISAYSTDTGQVRWLNQVEIREHMETYDAELDVAATLATFGPDDQAKCWGNGGSASSSWKQIGRLVNIWFEYPTLTYNLGISPKQFANIAALLAGGNVPRLTGWK